jgi:hypothetical protein
MMSYEDKKENIRQFLLLNQKSPICRHSKRLIIDTEENLFVIQCDKCQIMWELQGEDDA